jgi:lipoic acid synthetase
VLTPDFQGQEMPLARVLAERPDVFNHNVEVVPRLYPVARRGSSFARSCRVLALAHELGEGEVVTKSGVMVGLGETHAELVETFAQLRAHGVQVLTVGQYLRPSERHLPVVRYWHPEEFAALERDAYALGFEHVAAGPLVRSSYHADEHVRAGQTETADADAPLATQAAVAPAVRG